MLFDKRVIKGDVINLAPALMLLIVLGASVKSYATNLTYQDRNVTVTITADECSVPIIKQAISPEMLPNWRQAHVLWQGKDYEACYTMTTLRGQKMVLIVDETGDNGVLPFDQFEKKDAL